MNDASAPAATGPTVDLGRSAPVAPPPPSQPSASGQSYPQHPWPYSGGSPSARRRHDKLGFWMLVLGVFLLFGMLRGGGFSLMGLLFSLPGLLLVFGVGAYCSKRSRGMHDEALRTLVWLGGLALLFATGAFWPGILVLLGIMHLLRPQRRGWC